MYVFNEVLVATPELIPRHGQVCHTQAAVLANGLSHLSQHPPFVDSDRKLHKVTTLSERFPGISPYVSVMVRGRDALWVKGRGG